MIALAFPPLLTALALAAALWPWTSRYDGRPTVRLLAALVGASLLQVLLQVFLGSFGVLTPMSLFVLAWVVAVAGGVAGLRYRVPHPAPPLPPGPVSPLARLWSRAGLAPPTPLGLALGIVAVAFYALLVGIAALVPPYGWDTLTYHLSDVFHPAATGTLSLFPYPGRSSYYPKAGELHELWAFLLSGAKDASWRAISVGLFPLGLTAGVAVRTACLGLSLRAGLGWVVPAMALTPVMLIQPVAGYVDTAFAAFLLAALAFAILAAVEGRVAHLALCAVASGLAMGVKISFIYYCLPVVAVLAGARVWRLLSAGETRQVLARLLLLLACFSAGCGFWLGRNLLTTGNPIYPTRVSVAGVTILPGPRDIHPTKRQQSWFVPDTVSWARYPFLETFHERPAYTLENGFGPLFAAGLVATLAAFVLAIRRRLWVLARALAAVPLTVVPFIAISPYQEPRYVIACCGFALIGLAAVVEAAAGGLGETDRLPGDGPRAAGRGPLRLAHAAIALGIVFGAVGGAVSAAEGLDQVVAQYRHGSWSPEKYYRIAYGTAGDAFNWLASDAGAGKTVTLTNTSFMAPLYGWNGRNRFVYRATPDDPPVGQGPRCRTYAGWRKFLLDSRVDWIVVWVPWWGEEGAVRTEGWIRGHPEGFEQVKEFGGPEQVRARIYRPVFSAEERETLAAAGSGPDFAALDAAPSWFLEYRAGAEARISPDPAGGVRLDYSFGTAQNDYADLRAEVEEGDWSAFRYLSFDLDAPPGAALLFVYLKDRDPRRASRYRLDLRDGGTRRVRLDLDEPEWQTPDFGLRDVAEIHLVIDDPEDALTGKGTLRVAGFRLEPDSAAARAAKGEGAR